MSRGRTSRRSIGAGATLLLAIVAVAVPRAAAQGWLIGFGTAVAAPLGALALLLIHDLTGGAWGEAAAPRLTRLADLLPAFVVWFVILLLLAPAIYPWVRHPSAAGPGVAGLYLNWPLFALRGLVLLVGLSIVVVLRGRGLTRLASGLSLVFYVIAMNFVSVDWLLSLDPRYTSSAFGTQIVVAQLAVALAVVLFDGGPGLRAAPRGDLAALLLACLLGEAYLILMTLVVHWYGNLPDQAAWFLRRTEGGWRWFEALATLAGAVAPLAALMCAAVRRSPTLCAAAAAAALLGIFLEMVWLVAPGSGPMSCIAGVLALLIVGCLTPDLAAVLGRPLRRLRHGI